MSTSADIQTRDWLDAITERLQSGEAVEPLPAQAEADQGELDEVLEIMQSLQASLQPLSPSQDFADGLRAELIAGPGSVVKGLRKLPARVSIAAILALFAGCVLFMLRRLFGSEAAEIQEEAVATPL